MKKETLITALVFLSVGFLGGYVYNARQISVAKPAESAAPPVTSSPQETTTNPPAGNGGSGEFASRLPKGHPPLNDAEIIQFFKDVAAHNPADPAPRLKLANYLFDRLHFAEAIPWYQQVLQRTPEDTDARTDLATCYFNSGDSRQSLDELHLALRTDPHHEATLFNLVVVNLEGAHNVSAAEKAWQQLYAVNPNYPQLDRLKQLLKQAPASSKLLPAR